MKRWLAAAALCLSPGLLAAEIEWTPSGELGFVNTTGNSEATTVNAKLAVEGEIEGWEGDAFLSGLRGENSGQTSAERYEAAGTARRELGPETFLSSALRYERDDFSAFQYQGTVSVAYGFRPIADVDQTLRVEVGPGIRRAQPRGENDDTNLIGRAQGRYTRTLSDTARLYNTTLLETGTDNTFLQNELGVAVDINASLALKAAYQLRRNSQVIGNKEKLDTLTTINLVWRPGR
jgi:putative salt-induced outer membrane protein